MTYTPREKRTYEAMYEHTSRHGVKRALERMARDEDARTIREVLTHVSKRRAARWLARLLANDKGYSGQGGEGEDAPFAEPASEEETAKRVRNQLCLGEVCHFDRGCGCLTVIAAALRQRADEATRAENEACALIAEDEIPERLTGDALIVMRTAEAIAAAIRARIAPGHNLPIF